MVAGNVTPSVDTPPPDRPRRRVRALPRPNVGSAAEAELVRFHSRFQILLGLIFLVITAIGSRSVHGDEPLWRQTILGVFDLLGFGWLLVLGVRDQISAQLALARGRLYHRGLSLGSYMFFVYGVAFLHSAIARAAYWLFDLS
jgi:hypothetical protein